jgi:hypothetical protein
MARPGITGRFVGAAACDTDIENISAESVIEARDKEARLLNFFDNPFNDNGEPWHLAKIYWSYLRTFKTEGKKRKDKVTESILHELDPALYAATLLQTGYLTDKVTYQIRENAKTLLPPEAKPIENLFCTFPIHDMDEDSPDHSRDTLIEFGNDHISDLPSLTSSQEMLMRARIMRLADISDAITFGRKYTDIHGHVRKQNTHGNNLHVYNRAMQEYWEAIGVKGLDRLGGTITRFSRVPVLKFRPEDHMAYLSETRELFTSGQPLEDMQERYPQLSQYFDIVNMNLRIAIVCMDTMVQNHPNLDRQRYPKRGTIDPAQVSVSIKRHLRKAMVAADQTQADICPMNTLLEGLTAEAGRHQELQPIVDKVEQQMQPYLIHLQSRNNSPLVMNP